MEIFQYILSNSGELFLIFVICPFFLLFLPIVAGYMIYAHVLHPGPVYYPSKINKIREMLKLARVGKDDTVIDLGSGDGRILIEAAKMGARAIGYEIDPVLAYESRKKIKEVGLEKLVKVHLKSMWKADFNEATVVTLYLFPKFMKKLQKMFEEKLKHSVLVVSNDYQFPDKKYFKKEAEVYLYKF